MIIVRTMQEVNNIPVKSVIPYVRSLITNILNEYSSNGSIETVGAIYFGSIINIGVTNRAYNKKQKK